MSDKEVIKVIVNKIDDFETELNELSKYIWSNPEVMFTEHKAHDYVTNFLVEKCGFSSVERSYILPTAFRAEHISGDGPTVCLICEYDALPNIGHACGHNLICELGVAVSAALKKAMDDGYLKGKLVVMGCPAEEGGGGKVKMIEAGAFKGIDCALMCHPFCANVLYPAMLSTCQYSVVYRGKSAHAAASPWQGLNALDAGVQCYVNLGLLRQQLKPECRIHVIIIRGGEAVNIIPEECELHVMIRSVNEIELRILKDKLMTCVNAAAMATGCEVECKVVHYPYKNVQHNRCIGEVYSKYAKQFGQQFPSSAGGGGGGEVPPSGSTDMGNVSHEVPSIHPKFSISTAENIHTKQFAEAARSSRAQALTVATAKALAGTAASIFTDAHLLARIKDEFSATTFT